MNLGSIFTTKWLTKLKAVFGITEFQKKSVVITTVSSDVTAMRFNNLEVGEYFRITIQHRINASSPFRNRVEYSNDGNQILYSDLKDEDGQSISNGMSEVFMATADTLVCGFSRFTGSSNSSVHATLEKLPNHVETTKWT